MVQRPLWNISYRSNGNSFSCKGRLCNCRILIQGKNNTVEIKDNVKLYNIRISVKGSNNKLIIDKGVMWTECGRIRIEDENNTIRIGEDCDFRGCFFAVGDRDTCINISKKCLFSANVVIRTSDSHSILDLTGDRINHGKDVSIGEHVWIGNGAVVLKGTTIGDNCIIGTKSVISGKKIPSNCVVVGNPCKIVNINVSWDKQRIL